LGLINERGTDHQSSILKKCFSWLKVNLLRFAIKQIKHERGSGTLPRGIVDKGLYKRQKVGYATLGVRLARAILRCLLHNPPHYIRHRLLIYYVVVLLHRASIRPRIY
jgi:hypothetical protein